MIKGSRYFLFLLALAAAVYFYYISRHSGGIQAGDQAPVFTASSASGPVSLESFRGKTVLLNFWATWCPPCVREMPSLQKLHERLSGERFQVVAVSLDERVETVTSFLQKMPLTFPVLFDPHGDAAALYDTYQLPETYLIDPNGRVLRKYVGPQDWLDDDIVREIEKHAAHP